MVNHFYIQQISEIMHNLQLDFQDTIATIQCLFATLSQNFISAFLTIIDGRNNMLDSTRDLVLNNELYNANNAAAMNTLIKGTHHILRLSENIDWIKTNIFTI
jgi:hypothetical protein